MIAKTLECGKQRFVDTETAFVLCESPLIHSVEITNRFMTFYFISHYEGLMEKEISRIELSCKYGMREHAPAICHPDDMSRTWIGKHFPCESIKWDIQQHWHLWFDERESREDAIAYALEFFKPYMAPDFWNFINKEVNA